MGPGQTRRANPAPDSPSEGEPALETKTFGGENAGSIPAKEAVFSLEAASARQVLLAGDFTGWTKAPIKMEKDARGVWNASLTLPPGRHPYRFLVDGEWHDDPKCYQRVPNPFGTFDSIIEI